MIDDNRIKLIADHYGLDHQCTKLLEEMSELSVAIYSIKKKKEKSVEEIVDEFSNFLEELTDVDILIEQIKYKLADLNDKLNEIREYKLDRQIKRIEGE